MIRLKRLAISNSRPHTWTEIDLPKNKSKVGLFVEVYRVASTFVKATRHSETAR